MELALVVLVVVGVILAVLYQAGRKDFVLTYHDGRFTCKGRLPRRGELEQFLRYDLRIDGRVEIAGRRQRGRLVLWFGGELTPGQQQRIRNFLLTHN
jgi:hypothetical protein